MKHRQRLILSILFILLCTLTAGCSKKVTAEALFLNAAKEIKNAKSIDMDLLFDAEYGTEGENIFGTAGIRLNANVKTEEEKGYCIDGEAELEVLGKEASLPVQSYGVLGKEKSMVYLYNPITERWSGIEASKTGGSDSFVESIRGYLDLYESMTLSEQTREYRGRECYQVSGQISGSDLSGIIDQLTETLEGYPLDTKQLKSLQAEADFYFDKEKREFAGAVFTFDEPKASLEICINSYDDYTFKLPEKIVREAEEKGDENSDLDAADGIFKIEGRTYRLLDHADALEEDGWEFDEKVNVSEMVSAKDFEKFTFTKDGRSLELLFLNESKKEQSYRECKVVGVWDSSEDHGIVELDGGIGIGSDYDEVLAVFGKPEGVFVDEEYKEDDFSSLDYSFGKIKVSVYMTGEQADGLYFGIVWK